MEYRTKTRCQTIRWNFSISSTVTLLKERLNLLLHTNTTSDPNNMILAKKPGFQLGVTEYYGRYQETKIHKLNRK